MISQHHTSATWLATMEYNKSDLLSDSHMFVVFSAASNVAIGLLAIPVSEREESPVEKLNSHRPARRVNGYNPELCHEGIK